MAPNLNSEDYYQILGVPKSADDAALKKAYKKLAVKVRPKHARCRISARRMCTKFLRSHARDSTSTGL
jgi:preprotein translocase subunit Sec63